MAEFNPEASGAVEYRLQEDFTYPEATGSTGFYPQESSSSGLYSATSESSNPNSPGSYGGQSEEHNFQPNFSGIEDVDQEELELLDADHQAGEPSAEHTDQVIQSLQKFVAAEVLKEKREFDKRLCRAALKHGTYRAVTYPQVIDRKDDYARQLRHASFEVNTQGLHWRHPYEEHILLSSSYSQPCTCHPEGNRPLLELCCLRVFLNSSTDFDNTTTDEKGNQWIHAISDGRVGQVCVLLAHQEGIPVEIRGVYPIDVQKLSAYGCVRQDPVDNLNRFQIMFRQSGIWGIEALAHNHLFFFQINVAPAKKPGKKSDSSVLISPVSHSAPDITRVAQPLPVPVPPMANIPLQNGTLASASSQFSPATASAPLQPDAMQMAPGPVPFNPLQNGMVFVQTNPSGPRGVPGMFSYVSIGHGAERQMVDLHFRPTNQTPIPPDAWLPPQYISQMCDESDDADDTPWVQEAGQTDWVRPSDSRDASCLLKLELPPADKIREHLPNDTVLSSYQALRARYGKIRVRIPLGRQQQSQDPAIEINSKIRIKLKKGSGLSDPHTTNSEHGHGPPDHFNNREHPQDGSDRGSSRSEGSHSSVYGNSIHRALAYTLPRGTAIHAFSLTRHQKIVEGLMLHCSITAQLKNGATPLHLAAYAAPAPVFEILASNNDAEAAMKICDIHGFSPIDIAAHKKRHHILNVIRRLFPHLLPLPEDLFLNIGENCDFQTVTKLLLSCKKLLPGLTPFAHSEATRRSCFYFKISTTDDIDAIYTKLSERLKQQHVLFLDTEPGDNRFSPALLRHFLGDSLSDRFSNIVLKSVSHCTSLDFEDSPFNVDRASSATLSAQVWRDAAPRISRLGPHLKHLSLTFLDEYSRLDRLYANKFSIFCNLFSNLRSLELHGTIGMDTLYPLLKRLTLLEDLNVTSDMDIDIRLGDPDFSSRLRLRSLRFKGSGCVGAVSVLVPHLDNLRALRLVETNSTRMAEPLPKDFFSLTNLERLELSSAIGISETMIQKWFRHLHQLRSLRLDCNLGLGESSLISMIPATNLERLALSKSNDNFNIESSSKFVEWIAKMVQLTHLELTVGKLSTDFFETLAVAVSGLPYLSKLSVLDTTAYHLPRTDSVFWSRLDGAKMPRLKTVDFGRVLPLEDEDDSFIRFLREATSLKNISIDCEYLSPSQFAAIVTLHSSSLRKIVADPNQLKMVDSGRALSRLQTLSIIPFENEHHKINLAESLEGLKSLSELVLFGKNHQQGGLECLITRPLQMTLAQAVFLNSIELTRLQFEDNDVEENFGHWLSRLSLLTSFKIFDTSLDAAMDSICTGLAKAGSLVSASFCRTKLTDKSVTGMVRLCQSLPSLSSLELYSNAITAAGATRLVEGLVTRGKLLLNLRRNEIKNDELTQLRNTLNGTRIKLRTGDPSR